ncbi:hypothetical protein [Colwellia piezophila]|uniref:hypothetical protein n=1 Tax=Colwellia piezophila TaxID=211668 RepID=UPI000364E1A2|nr:hypothetical protein [Colwellia piezophila]
MKHVLSFGYITLLSDNIAEVVVNPNIIISLEMVEEFDYCLKCHFNKNFGLLINKINKYTYTFEAQLTIASLSGIKAIAVVTYNQYCEQVTNALVNTRKIDNLNLRQFSGLELELELGFQSAVTWLEQELS